MDRELEHCCLDHVLRMSNIEHLSVPEMLHSASCEDQGTHPKKDIVGAL